MSVFRRLVAWNRARVDARRARRVAQATPYAQWRDRFGSLGEAELSILRGRHATSQSEHFLVLIDGRALDASGIEGVERALLAQTDTRWLACVLGYEVGSKGAVPAADERVSRRQRSPGETWGQMIDRALSQTSARWVVWVGAGQLQPWALSTFARLDELAPDVVMAYSDHEETMPDESQPSGRFKPDFNAWMLRSWPYVGRPLALLRAQVQACGGWSDDLDDADLLDLTLRCTEHVNALQCRRLPFVLLTECSQATQPASMAHAEAVQAHMERMGVAARVEVAQGATRVHYALPAALPKVSIIIPSRDRPELLDRCVRSVVNATAYTNFEILLIDNGTQNPTALAMLTELAQDARVRVIADDSPFNYSRLNNDAVAVAAGVLLCLMNNDIEVLDPHWLHELVSVAVQPGVGAVGARLLYPDGSLQHAGLVLGLDGVAGHPFKRCRPEQLGAVHRSALVQEMSAVTAAVLVTPKALYQQLGGLNERDLAVAFNDVDYCLRVRAAGYKVIYDAHATFVHHESVSRGKDRSDAARARLQAEVSYMQQRWAQTLQQDPAYNPNLTLEAGNFAISDAPRASLRHWLGLAS
jgi:GT2 family glycosyltransferase